MFGWLTSHTARKTVATVLDERGMTARQIADQLGHARPSMTQDVYMGRKVVNSAVVHLDSLFPKPGTKDFDHGGRIDESEPGRAM